MLTFSCEDTNSSCLSGVRLGFTRAPPGLHPGSTRAPPGLHPAVWVRTAGHVVDRLPTGQSHGREPHGATRWLRLSGYERMCRRRELETK